MLSSPPLSSPPDTSKSIKPSSVGTPPRQFDDLGDPPLSEIATTSAEGNNSRTTKDILKDSFAPFDIRGELVEPFQEQVRKDAEARDEFRDMLLDVFLEFHAWSSARPKVEEEQFVSNIEREASSIMDIEREQGRSLHSLSSSFSTASSTVTSSIFVKLTLSLWKEETRARLGQFIASVQNALTALVNVAF